MAGPDFSHEHALKLTPVCGIDEAGRGPWAGPVVAAAVVLNPDDLPDGLNDSKKLSRSRREALFAELRDRAVCATGIASVEEIDRLNILQATYLAMRRAVDELEVDPAHALVDGRQCPPGLNCAATPVIGGDGRSLSIAAASIVAKVTRDRMMVALAQQYPGYGWERNAGYGVPEHQRGLEKLGVSPHHRRSFKPIHNILYPE